LKGIASTIPNQSILINTLGLQEAKDSSAIENIITTHDDLYKSELNLDAFKSFQAKEVQNYIAALKKGFELAMEKGFHFAITMDSDLQHQPKDIRKFLIKQMLSNADFIYGKRFFSLYKMPIHRILSNSFYYGKYEWPENSGEWHSGKHREMISVEEFQIVQKTLTRKTKARSKKHDINYRGLMTCKHCGGSGQITSGGGFFQMRQTCPVCQGEGMMNSNPCMDCNGSGRVKKKKHLTLSIPKGVESGSRLRLSGKGESGIRGGSAGDLYVVLHIKEHSVFHREGNDLLCEFPVSFALCALGGNIEIPTIDGKASLKVPTGSKTGKTFRLRGKGVPRLGGHGQGDLHIRIIPEVPTKLTSKQKKLLKDWLESETHSNYPERRAFDKNRDVFYEKKEAIKKDGKK
jgi:curved DNA-binding protein CbpA